MARVHTLIIGAVVVGGLFLFGGETASKAIGSIFSIKLFTVILVLITAYIVVAYIARFEPFPVYVAPVYYTCATNSAGENIGGCVKIDQDQLNALPKNVSSYNTLAACQADINSGNGCQQYWRCTATGPNNLYTGGATQCVGAFDTNNDPCPYVSQNAAQNACTNFTFYCNQTTPSAPVCTQINFDAVPSGEVVYQANTLSAAQSKCAAACVATAPATGTTKTTLMMTKYKA